MGWGGDVNVPVTWMMLRCWYWIGVGWCGDVNAMYRQKVTISEPKELCNKQKLTRDVNDSIRDYVFAFVCRAKWGIGKTLQNLADLASMC